MANVVSDFIFNKCLGTIIKIFQFAFESPTNCVITVILTALISTVIAVIIRNIADTIGF